MTNRGPDAARDEELAALVRLQELPDFQVYLTVLKRHADDLRRDEHKVLIDEKTIAEHNYRAGQVDGLTLAGRLPALIEQTRQKTEPAHG